jgi:hypothetical protein
MKLGKIARTFLIIFDMTLVIYVINSVVIGQVPRDQPAFWIATAIEILLGFLTYRFWMRSLLRKGFNSDKVTTLVIFLFAVLLPFLFDFSKLKWLQPAVTADRFYYCAIVTLLIYSSFVIDKHLKNHKL